MSILLIGVQLGKRDVGILSTLHLSFVSWYYGFSVYVLRFIVGSSPETLSMHVAGFNLVAVVALILSAAIADKMDTAKALYSWSLISASGTAFIYFAPNGLWRLLFYYLLGVAFGVGQVMFYRYFTILTAIEERGRIGGLLASVTLAVFPLAIALAEGLDFSGTIALCIVLNLGVLAIRLSNPRESSILTLREYRNEPQSEERTILLYMVPWVIFTLVNATLQKSISSFNLQYFSQSAVVYFVLFQTVGGCFGAIMGGIFADFFGRKVSLALGLTLYGLSSALSGIMRTYETVFFAHLINGYNWGIFLTLYQLVVWGDLCTAKKCARLYSLGLGIFHISTAIGYFFTPAILQLPLAVASLSSCLLIFLSNVPLILAPELLPSSFREKIRLKLYVDLLRRRRPGTSAGQG